MRVNGTMYFEEHLSIEKLKEKFVPLRFSSRLPIRTHLPLEEMIWPRIIFSSLTTATLSNPGVHPIHSPRLMRRDNQAGEGTLIPMSSGARSPRRSWVELG